MKEHFFSLFPALRDSALTLSYEISILTIGNIKIFIDIQKGASMPLPNEQIFFTLTIPFQ